MKKLFFINTIILFVAVAIFGVFKLTKVPSGKDTRYGAAISNDKLKSLRNKGIITEDETIHFFDDFPHFVGGVYFTDTAIIAYGRSYRDKDKLDIRRILYDAIKEVKIEDNFNKAGESRMIIIYGPNRKQYWQKFSRNNKIDVELFEFVKEKAKISE